MKKILFLLSIILSTISAATPEQVDRYLLLSHSDEQLANLETQFTQMQNRIVGDDTNVTEYDTQMLSIRFKEKLQDEISDNEMDEVLENYKNPILLKFVYETSGGIEDVNALREYIARLKADPTSKDRIKIVEKINEIYSNKDGLTDIYNTMFKPFIQKMIPGKKDPKKMKEMQKKYIESIKEVYKMQLLYSTRDFSKEELDGLLKVMKTPAMNHEIRATYGAIAYAMKDFMNTIASRVEQKIKERKKVKHNLNKNN